MFRLFLGLSNYFQVLVVVMSLHQAYLLEEELPIKTLFFMMDSQFTKSIIFLECLAHLTLMQ